MNNKQSKVANLSNYLKTKSKETLKNIHFDYVVLSLIGYYVLKTIISYQFEFSLGIKGVFQIVLAFLSITITGFVCYSIPYLVKSKRWHMVLLILVNLLLTGLVVGNIYYYREFSDFLSVDTILKSSSNSGGLLGSTLKLMKPYDIVYVLDTLVLWVYLIVSKRKIKTYSKSYSKLALSVSSCFLLLTLVEIDRPQLLTRSFDNNYLVKYLGLAGFTGKNGYDYSQLQTMRANATENDLGVVTDYLSGRRETQKGKYFGVAKDKNVVYIHLESFQQFLIDYKLKDDTGKEHEVTPFLNKLYHSQDSLSYDNSFHQVGQGKTSDAEMMIENSLFGTDNGSAMVKYGKDNTFYSAPTIFKELGYTTNVFHGNTETFWNRNNAYKSFGYDNFFSLKHFKNQDVIGYGIKDENFFQESSDMYQQIQGKKYSKLIPVSNHFPYNTNYLNSKFSTGTTGDDTVNNYFVTANYMDKQIESFYNSLSKEELNNTIFVLYGDHYGISNSRNKYLNEELKLTENDNWNSYYNTQLQRVPLIFNMPNSNINTTQQIQHEYIGQIDILPSLLNLMGVENKDFLFMGQNVFSNNFDGIVEFRNGDFITKDFTYTKGTVYRTDNGDKLDMSENSELYDYISKVKQTVSNQLLISDDILNKNLLQFRYNRVDVSEKLRFNY